jgi:hypothetical protein
MTRQEYVLAVLTAGNGDEYTATQVQKLFFLLDRRAAKQVGGPWFDFQPHEFGPRDLAVYEELRALAARKLVAITETPSFRLFYRVTASGREEGQRQLAKLSRSIAAYIRQVSDWVLGLSFDQLVSAIYQEFPEMRANALFQVAQ